MARRLSNDSSSSLPLSRPFEEEDTTSAQLVAAYAQQPSSIWPDYPNEQASSPQPPPQPRPRRPRRSAPITDASTSEPHASRLSWCSIQSEPAAESSQAGAMTRDLHRRPINGMASAPSLCNPLPPIGLFHPSPLDRYVPPLRANEVVNRRRSKKAAYWLSDAPDDVEILNDPSIPESLSIPDTLDRDEYERAQAAFRNNPWAPFEQGLYTPPESVTELDSEEGFAKICALLEERDRKHPPNPAAVHLLLNPNSETPRCTYVDLNSAEYNVHLNPTGMYDDRDFMLPATATRDTVLNIVIDWPIHPTASPLLGQVRPVYDIEIRHDDYRFGDEVVSIDDVWNAVYSCLRRPLERQQYWEYSKEDRKSIVKAYERRCKKWPGNSRDGGLLYVDLLCGKNRFTGLAFKEADGEVCWQACFEQGRP